MTDQERAAYEELERIANYRASEIRRLDRKLGQGCSGARYVKRLKVRARAAETAADLYRAEAESLRAELEKERTARLALETTLTAKERELTERVCELSARLEILRGGN